MRGVERVSIGKGKMEGSDMNLSTDENFLVSISLLIKYASDANELTIPASDSDDDLDNCLRIHLLLNAVVIGLQSLHGGYEITAEELQHHLDMARDSVIDIH